MRNSLQDGDRDRRGGIRVRSLAAFLTVTASLFAFAVASRSVDAQQPTPRPATDRPAPTASARVGGLSSREGAYLGVATCAGSGCHGSTLPLRASRVLQNEYFTWLNYDKHARAYNVLFNPRSARIVKNMKLRGRAYEEKMCLDCHATNVPSGEGAGIDREDGIQCETCHGPAGGWRSQHTDSGWTHADSVRAGMIDLRSVPVRARTCLTCHQGRGATTVDHELIASGHPVLTFELDNYSGSMPPHWAKFSQRSDGQLRDTHGVRAWAVGQVIAFKESLDALALHARGDKWPEFSDMSCYDCHHDLGKSGWRQERGYNLRAGLPGFNLQRYAVLRHLIGQVTPSDRASLDRNIATLGAHVSRMNNPAAVATLASSTSAMVAKSIPAIDAARWDESSVRSLISRIASDGPYLLSSDVHSAEQTALALQSLTAYLARLDGGAARGDMLKTVDRLFALLENRSDYDPARFVQTLRQLQSTGR
ncbi:MAG TPA: multiheme c-type cytochrome [Thermoanaerobaculia bacterium]|nr:multiheme c-type cytochrome [Thermoanaerobaculia bacterium]